MGLVTIEDTVNTYKYKCSNINLLHDFKDSATILITYMKTLVPNPAFENKYKMIVTYQRYILKFIIDILNENGHKINQTVTNDLLENFLKINTPVLLINLGLKEIPLDPEKDFYKNMWGPRYWDFLHNTSIILQVNNSKLISNFACLLLNFNLLLMCNYCAQNFKAKDPLSELTIKIEKTKDPITVLFNFHNVVNEKLNKDKYAFASFLIQYKLDIIGQDIVSYSETIQY